MAVTIYGPDGNPIKRDKLTEEIVTVDNAGARSVWRDEASRGLSPRRLAGVLRSAAAGDILAYMNLAEDMEEKDLHYVGVLNTRKRAVAQLEITVEAAGEETAYEAHASLVRDMLSRDPLQDELYDILDSVGKGFSVCEILWETSSRQWMPKEIRYVLPQFLMVDRSDGRTIKLRDGAGAIPLEPYKFIQHETKAKSGLAIRAGLARIVSWYWLFKNYTIKDWVSFSEGFGSPLRLGKYPKGSTEGDKQTLMRALRAMGTDAAAIIPEGMMVEFMSALSKGGATGADGVFMHLADYIDQQVSKAVLGQTGTTDAIAGGHAVGKIHNEVRGDIEAADAAQLSATLKRDLVRPLIDLNFGPQKKYPNILIGAADSVDAKEFTEAIARLLPYGFRVSQTEVRSKLGLKDPDKDDETFSGSQAAGPNPAPVTQTATASTASARVPDLQAIQALAEGAAERHQDALIDSVRAALQQARSIPEAQALIMEIAARPDAGTARIMAEAFAVANLAGAAAIENGQED